MNLLLFGGIVITSEIDFSQFFCWNEDCPDYGIKNQGNIVFKLTFRILAFLYKSTTQIYHFDEFLLIKWPISKNNYPKLAGVRNVHLKRYTVKITMHFLNVKPVNLILVKQEVLYFSN